MEKNDPITNVFVKYHDLKCDIHVEINFDSPNDMIMFFSKYNPCSIDIEYMESLFIE